MIEYYVLFAGMVAMALLSMWMAALATYWKGKYFELYEAQQRYQRAHERARGVIWPPIQH